MDSIPELRESGFELDGEFYPWRVSDTGEDLIIIDRFTALPAADFFEAIEDDTQRGRTPITLALMATSIRAKQQEWTLERVIRTVMKARMGEVEFMTGSDEEEGDARPPEESTPERSSSSSVESSASSTPLDGSPDAMLYEIRA